MMAISYAHSKYGHPDYDDNMVKGMMQYFKIETYSELLDFLANTKKRAY